jgi:hypothetical protein
MSDHCSLNEQDIQVSDNGSASKERNFEMRFSIDSSSQCHKMTAFEQGLTHAKCMNEGFGIICRK